MKMFAKTAAVVLVFFVCIPLLAVSVSGTFGNAKNETGISFLNKVQVPNEIRVWREEKKKVEKVDFEDYVASVVASEMPCTFDTEALKAQSVAARTFAMSKIKKYKVKKPANHTKAPICDTTHCQVFKTDEELFDCHDDDWAESKNGWLKIKKACNATKGELLYYDGKLVMQPLFFSSSGGQTENSEDVFVSAVPYLIGVSSPYEEKATHRNEEKTFTLKTFKNKVKEAFPEKEFGEITREKIKIISRTSGGRVERMQIGDATLKGTQVRSAIGLSSALFSISFEEGSGWKAASDSNIKIIFTSSGSGHGVGMSQYGADGMAKEGYNYREILNHYYSGTEVY